MMIACLTYAINSVQLCYTVSTQLVIVDPEKRGGDVFVGCIEVLSHVVSAITGVRLAPKVPNRGEVSCRSMSLRAGLC